jgi:hypothetical protein
MQHFLQAPRQSPRLYSTDTFQVQASLRAEILGAKGTDFYPWLIIFGTCVDSGEQPRRGLLTKYATYLLCQV